MGADRCVGRFREFVEQKDRVIGRSRPGQRSVIVQLNAECRDLALNSRDFDIRVRVDCVSGVREPCLLSMVGSVRMRDFRHFP